MRNFEKEPERVDISGVFGETRGSGICFGAGRGRFLCSFVRCAVGIGSRNRELAGYKNTLRNGRQSAYAKL
jgi:hypothetical protein